MIRVINKHFEPYTTGQYVGRPSILGNPFVIGRDGTREEVVEKYRRWLWGQTQRRGKVYQKLLELKEKAIVEDLNLICWCAPKPCHADILKGASEWLLLEDVRLAARNLAKAFDGVVIKDFRG